MKHYRSSTPKAAKERVLAAALSQYMRDVRTPVSAISHQWLTLDEFGKRFGPSDSDIRRVSDWLIGLSRGKTLIEFWLGRFAIFL
jgi:hypothetical protein